jgi:cytochrome c553
MPSLLHRVLGNPDETATDLAHYLTSLSQHSTSSTSGKPKAKPKSALHANAERGDDLFRNRGCAACHPTSDVNVAPAFLSRLANLTKKYSLPSLAAFLESPTTHRPDARMPAIPLTPQDAFDIAAHLLDFRTSDPRQAKPIAPLSPHPERVQRGAAHFEQLQCNACHNASPKPWGPTIPIRNTARGCLALKPSNAPRFELTNIQRKALAAYLLHPDQALPTAEARWRHTTQALNCTACHAVDQTGGPAPETTTYFTGDEAIGDTGRIPPPLTRIGAKLQPTWMQGVLEGSNRKRPYIHTRMPSYSGMAKHLTQLASESAHSENHPVPDDLETREVGRILLGSHGGMNCITCHRWNDRPSLGIQALDLHDSGKRLQASWLHDYLRNPATYRANTLMPALWPAEKSAIPLLNGSSSAQINAVLAFLQKPEGEPLGLPSTDSSAFEIVPKERPVIQRAFLEGVGPHAILVGFPSGFHLAFDGLSGTPALLWKGRFFDAYSTWFSRQAPFESPLSKQVVQWPKNTGTGDSHAKSFQGYRTDKSGNPTFLVLRDGTSLEETFTADSKGIHRVIRAVNGPLPASFTHPETLTPVDVRDVPADTRHFHYLWTP